MQFRPAFLSVILLGMVIGLLFFFLEFLRFRYEFFHLSFDSLLGILILILLPLGILMGWYWKRYAKEKETDDRFSPVWVKEQLSKREWEVFLEICQGKSNAEIAEHLHISLTTVKTHVSNILSKLGVQRRTQLVRLCEPGISSD